MNTLQNLVGPSTAPKRTTWTSAAGQTKVHQAPNDRSRKSKRNNDTNVVLVDGKKPPKDLNSFIAFRTYYAPIFVSLQQKYISGFLTYLWEKDFDKNKWGIIAKAYSVIRNKKGKKNAPLDSFLDINVPFMGISKPGAYFFDHGWEVAAVNGGCSVLRHTVDSVHAESGSTSLNSVNDVLHNSYAKGYVDEILTEPANHVALMMAISVKPIFAPLATNVSANDVVEEDSAAEGVQDPMSISIATSLDANEAAMESPSFPVQDTVSPGAMQFVDGEVQGELYPELDSMSPLNEVFQLVGEHPFDNEFMPTTDHSAWNPFADDLFAAYHMSEVNDSDSGDWFNHDVEQ